MGEDGAGVHLEEATVVLFEGFQGGELVEVNVAFHMGQDDGVAVGAEVLDGVADLLFRSLWRKLDENGHGLV